MSFIKLHRDLMESYCFANPNHLKVWIWLLLKANFKKTYIPFTIGRGITTIELDRGQLIFGRFTAEEELGMDGSMIYRILKKLEDLEQIIIEPNNKYSIISICKYDSYQNNNCEVEQQVNNKRTTDEQQVNTLQEGKEGKEVFNNIIGKKFVYEDFNELPNNYIQSAIQQLHLHKQKKVSEKEVISNWEAFKLQYLTGTTFYNNQNSVYQHFVNWIKNQNFTNGTNQSNSKSANKSISSISSVASANFEALRNWADQFSDEHPNSNAK